MIISKMYLVFIFALFFLINSVIMVARRGYVGRFSFEFNGIPSILWGFLVGFFSAIVSYGYIKDILASGNTSTYFTLAITLTILGTISWFLHFKFFR